MKSADADEFHAFVQARWPGLVRMAHLLTGNPADAEDLAQTALTKAYVAWRRVQRSDNPDAYVRRILFNAHASRFRRRRVVEYLTADLPDAPTHADDPAERIGRRQALLTALAELPRKQRAVVILRYWEDLSEAETAATLGCAVGTVKSQASKGLAKLRAHPALRGGSTFQAAA